MSDPVLEHTSEFLPDQMQDSTEDDSLNFFTTLAVIVILAATLAHSGRLLWIAYVLRSVGAG